MIKRLPEAALDPQGTGPPRQGEEESYLYEMGYPLKPKPDLHCGKPS